nr:hypothetical protein [Tanacetum cinerariifolium]
MGDEHLDTIPAIKSDEFIKSSVENLVPNPSESEGKHECDVPACDDFTTFSNLLFDVDEDFSSSDDESFSDEDISKKIYSNPLFNEEIISIMIYPHHFNAESDLIEYLLNHDSLIISSSSKIVSLLDEFAGELTLLKSITPGINETDCDPEEETHLIDKLLYDNSFPRPLEEFIFENSKIAIESFSPSHIPVEDSDSFMEEINLSFTPDDPMPPGIEEDHYDSERDILILEEFLSNDSLSLLKNESFHFDIPSSFCPPVKPLDGNSRILNVKVMGDISKHKGHEVSQPSTECPMMIYERNTPILDVQFLHFYPHVLGDGEFCQRCTCMSISENSSQSPPQINYHYCYGCGDSIEDIFCHQCTCESCGKGAHYGYNCPPKVPVISNPKPCNNQTIDELPQTLPSFDPTCYSRNESPFTCDSTPNIIDYSPNVFNPPSKPPKYSYEFCGKDAYYAYDCPPQRKKEEEEKQIAEEQVAKARYWKIPICYDDDEDYTIEITPKEPDNSLSMGDEHLDTIPAMESDEFIKSSVENLIQILSEVKGIPEHRCDVPSHDNSPPLDVLKDQIEDFFESNKEFSSIDDDSFS